MVAFESRGAAGAAASLAAYGDQEFWNENGADHSVFAFRQVVSLRSEILGSRILAGSVSRSLSDTRIVEQQEITERKSGLGAPAIGLAKSFDPEGAIAWTGSIELAAPAAGGAFVGENGGVTAALGAERPGAGFGCAALVAATGVVEPGFHARGVSPSAMLELGYTASWTMTQTQTLNARAVAGAEVATEWPRTMVAGTGYAGVVLGCNPVGVHASFRASLFGGAPRLGGRLGLTADLGGKP